MQRIKNTKFISEIEVIASNSEKLTNSLAQVIDKFELNKHFALFDFLKRKGFAVSNLLNVLIILPFAGVASVYDLMKHGIKDTDCQAKKDAYYDIKNNENVDWRKLLLLHAKRFMLLVNKKITVDKKNITAFIFDDTLLEKTGRKIEKVSFVFDHVTRRALLGFKLLVCGFWDGKSFIPLDFSIHRERGTKGDDIKNQYFKAKKDIEKSQKKVALLSESYKKKQEKETIANKEYQLKSTKANQKRLTALQAALSKEKNQLDERNNEQIIITKEWEKAKRELKEYYSKGRLFGLTGQERKEQYKKILSSKSQGFIRRKEADRSKIEMMLKMFSRAVKHGIIADYILVDSWFFCQELVEKLKEIKKGAIKLVSMVKINNQLFTDCETGKIMALKPLLNKYEREAVRCKKFKSNYIKIACKYGDNRVNLFFVKISKSSKWHLLLTTDLSLNFIKLMEVYHIRWSIEVYFKESKQYLSLGGCKSSNFDAQIADTTIAMMQYIMLCYCKRINYQNSFGDLFKQLNKEMVELSLVARLLEIFWELVELLCDIASIDFGVFQKELIQQQEVVGKLLSLFPDRVVDKAA